MTFKFSNRPEATDEIPVPCYVLKGESNAHNNGLIKASSAKFPTQYYEVTEGYFKVYVQLFYGVNKYKLKHIDGKYDDTNMQFHPGEKVYDEIEVSLNYRPLDNYSVFQIPKIHFFILSAADSPQTFDCPRSTPSGENDWETAERKLHVAGRIMQMFTLDEMDKHKLGKRCFQFEEESGGEGLTQIKVLPIDTESTLSEIRDPNNAQQNEHASHPTALFDIAVNALRSYGGEFSEDSTGSAPAMAAVLVLDSHWDPQNKLILGHAGIGSDDGPIKIALFGSHGIHSWPNDWSEIHRCFTDCTKLSTEEVANDCGCCGTNWECFCCTLGSFLQVLGHSLGTHMQESGVMSGDFKTLDRMFLTKERYSSNTGKLEWGPVLEEDEPSWNSMDAVRFLYHPAFSLQQDFDDHTFKVPTLFFNKGMKVPDLVDAGPNVLVLDDDTIEINSDTGIYAVAFFINNALQSAYEYVPAAYDGPGPQHHLQIKYSAVAKEIGETDSPLTMEVLSVGFGEKIIRDVRAFLRSHCSGRICKSELYGGNDGEPQEVTFPRGNITKFRVTHGLGLDGVDTFFDNGNMSSIGNFKHHYSIFELVPGEKVTSVVIRSGAWVDGIQFVTNMRKSPHFGEYGGNYHRLVVPDNCELCGFYCLFDDWIMQFGVAYRRVTDEGNMLESIESE